eukprot:1138839-Pelagomonas_calceolata.AAC.5
MGSGSKREYKLYVYTYPHSPISMHMHMRPSSPKTGTHLQVWQGKQELTVKAPGAPQGPINGVHSVGGPNHNNLHAFSKRANVKVGRSTHCKLDKASKQPQLHAEEQAPIPGGWPGRRIHLQNAVICTCPSTKGAPISRRPSQP